MEQKSSDATFEMAVYHWRLYLNAENMSSPGFDLTLGSLVRTLYPGVALVVSVCYLNACIYTIVTLKIVF